AVMHDLPLAFSCSDSIAVLQNGRISACDTPQNICQSGIVKSVFGVELGYCAEGDYYHYNI
ncbi:MAG: ABC transporter ATP-binding protein, partial [Clostridium sp.]|nr:ABC transporter ATP-binding protein [Clostridium sp.]